MVFLWPLWAFLIWSFVDLFFFGELSWILMVFCSLLWTFLVFCESVWHFLWTFGCLFSDFVGLLGNYMDPELRAPISWCIGNLHTPENFMKMQKNYSGWHISL